MNAPILSSLKINLPTQAGRLETFVLSEPRAYPDKAKGAFNRVAFSAAHVVADARAANDPWVDCALDWDATLRYREYLWALAVAAFPPYAEYQAKTTRKIPLFVAEPAR